MHSPRVTVVLLCWHTHKIAEFSVARIAREALVTDSAINVIVVDVDHGSRHDYTKYSNSHCDVKLIRTINQGPSVNRNLAISKVRTRYTFLLDGDIMYVEGTIHEYMRVMRSRLTDTDKPYVVIGNHSQDRVNAQGFNGVKDMAVADKMCPRISSIESGYPMAWTQYGLFPTAMLHRYPFSTQGPLGMPGHGYEDDWMYWETIHEAEYWYTANPCYYHDAHSSLGYLEDSYTNARAHTFVERFGYDLFARMVEMKKSIERKVYIPKAMESSNDYSTLKGLWLTKNRG